MAGSITCERVIGDFEIDTLEPIGAEATGEDGFDAGIPEGGGRPLDRLGTGLGVRCTPGEMRCSGALLEICLRVDSDRPPQWVVQNDCYTAELCASEPVPRCLARRCDPGEQTCRGAVPMSCDATLTGWVELPACISSAHCSTNPVDCAGEAPCCLRAPCLAAELRCNGRELEECLPDSSGWVSVQRCETNELCLAGLANCGTDAGACTCQPPECEAEEARCHGSVLARCNASETGWHYIEACASVALCERGAEEPVPRCEPARCRPEEHACSASGVLQVCNIEQTGFEDVQACAGPAFCDASGGRCERPACEPGQRRCNGAQIEVCRQDQTAFETSSESCASSALCNDDDPANVRCDAPACNADQFDCAGAQLRSCNGDRTGFTNVGAACSRADLCSAARRRCDYCVPNRRECNPGLTATRVCDGGGNSFGQETPCPDDCDAATGQCR
ncbi:MAG TPA: hypothetical protein VNN80_35025 [Polyangiaceae bacterium]|nr:hypothetical protein [Polyangiaceae bacterium]